MNHDQRPERPLVIMKLGAWGGGGLLLKGILHERGAEREPELSHLFVPAAGE